MSTDNSEYVVNHIRKRKKDLINVFGGKCCICGFDKFQSALEFHHVNPEEKSFGIGGSNAATKNLEDQLQEAQKCILVCANCHRGIHEGLVKIPLNWRQFYNYDYADELRQENYNLKHGIEKTCPNCGKIISRDAMYCKNCSDFLQRKVERPSREELKQLIYTTPFTQIATKYQVSDNAVRKWCKSMNLPFKKTVIKTYSKEDWEKI